MLPSIVADCTFAFSEFPCTFPLPERDYFGLKMCFSVLSLVETVGSNHASFGVN